MPHNITNVSVQSDASGAPAIAALAKVQVNVIQDLLKNVMIQDVHYGAIPGCGAKPTLLKAGAEKLLFAFHLGAEPSIEKEADLDSVTYTIRARIFNIADGKTVGVGVGVCSSLEDKYRWRKAVSDDEFNAAREDQRRVKFTYKEAARQVLVNYHDVENTVLKMAKKRALVDAVLTATAASDIFTQDFEDWSEEMIYGAAGVNAAKPAPANRQKADPVNENPPSRTNKPMPKAITDSTRSELIEALAQLGFDYETKGNYIAARGKTYGKSDQLKALGFQYKPDTKTWYRAFSPDTKAAA